jgi:8-oxo-dGTP diphosphatase
MLVYLLRHGEAKSRRRWAEADDLRPLNKQGRLQADALVDALAEVPIARVLASPSVRCRKTVEPIAAARGVRLEPDARLAEGTGSEGALELLDTLEDDPARAAILCTHGDVVQLTVQHLEAAGVVFEGPILAAKGAAWVLHGSGGAVTAASYLPPPA